MHKKLTGRRYECTIFANKGVFGGLEYNTINDHITGLRLRWTRAGWGIDSVDWRTLDVDTTCSDMCDKKTGRETHTCHTDRSSLFLTVLSSHLGGLSEESAEPDASPPVDLVAGAFWEVLCPSVI